MKINNAPVFNPVGTLNYGNATGGSIQETSDLSAATSSYITPRDMHHDKSILDIDHEIKLLE